MTVQLAPIDPPSRAAIRQARRVLVKAGTSVVTNDDGRPSLTRLGAIVEQVAELHRAGLEIIFVSSGAVGMGKHLLKRQGQRVMSFHDLQIENERIIESTASYDASYPADINHGARTTPVLIGDGGMNGTNGGLPASGPPLRPSPSFANLLATSDRPHTAAARKKTYDSACAAAGQFEMMNLYNSLFRQFDVTASQLLLTQADFGDVNRLDNLRYAVERLLSVGIIPLVNENDAVSANLGYTDSDLFSDNDSLAALCARSFNAEVCLLLTDVDGVYDRPPSEVGSKMLSYFGDGHAVGIGEKSLRGKDGEYVCNVAWDSLSAEFL